MATDDFLSHDDQGPVVPPELLPDREISTSPYIDIYWHDDGCGMGGEYISVSSCGASIPAALWHSEDLLAIANDMRVHLEGGVPLVPLTSKNIAAVLDMLASDLGVQNYADQALGSYLHSVADKLRQSGEYHVQRPKPKVDE